MIRFIGLIFTPTRLVSLEILYANIKLGAISLSTNNIFRIFCWTEAEAVIQGPEYVKAGSTINLTCTINLPDMQGKSSGNPFVFLI